MLANMLTPFLRPAAADSLAWVSREQTFISVYNPLNTDKAVLWHNSLSCTLTRNNDEKWYKHGGIW
jgi:hypothetical protein